MYAAMHGFSLGRPGAVRGPCAGRAPTVPRADHSGTYTGQSGLPTGRLLVTFPGDCPPSPLNNHAGERPKHSRFHLDNRGAPVKRLLDAKTDGLDTPYRYRKYPARPDTPEECEPVPVPVCNLNKLNAMLDTEAARAAGDSLPIISPRAKAKSRNIYQRQTHSYAIMDPNSYSSYYKLEQTRQDKKGGKERERERRKERGTYKESTDHSITSGRSSGKTSSSLPTSSSDSFLKGSAIESLSQEDKSLKSRRQSYDARAYANKAPRRKSKDKEKIEKFSSLPNISKVTKLTSTECTVYVPSENMDISNSKTTFRMSQGQSQSFKRTDPKTETSSTKFPLISGHSDNRSEVGTEDGRFRLTQSEPGHLSLPYSFQGSSSKGNARQKGLSLRQMTEAFRQHMGDRYGRPGGSEDKRWADKMSKVRSVIDNNSYDLYARKPLPKYSVSKLALAHAAPITVSTDNLSSFPVPEGEEGDDLDLPVGYIPNYDYELVQEEYDEEHYEVDPVPVPPEWSRQDDAMWDDAHVDYQPFPVPDDYVEAMEYYGNTGSHDVKDNPPKSEVCVDIQSTAPTINHQGTTEAGDTIDTTDKSIPTKDNTCTTDSEANLSNNTCVPKESNDSTEKSEEKSLSQPIHKDPSTEATLPVVKTEDLDITKSNTCIINPAEVGE